MTNLNETHYSEPLELFFHGDKGPAMANTAFDVAAKIYDLEAAKFTSNDHFIGFMKLRDVDAQKGAQSRLFKQSMDLIRTLVHYKKDVLSEPSDMKKVNMKDLRDALNVMDAFY